MVPTHRVLSFISFFQALICIALQCINTSAGLGDIVLPGFLVALAARADAVIAGELHVVIFSTLRFRNCTASAAVLLLLIVTFVTLESFS